MSATTLFLTSVVFSCVGALASILAMRNQQASNAIGCGDS